MTAYLERAGFEVVRADYAADHLHVSYVAQPSTPRADALPPAESVAALWREVRSVQNAPASTAADRSASMGHVLALVPARGGSKGIPDKNIRPLGRTDAAALRRAGGAGIGRRRSNRAVDRFRSRGRRRAPRGTRGAVHAACRAGAGRHADAAGHRACGERVDRAADGSRRSSCCSSRRRRCEPAAHIRAAVQALRDTGADSVVTVVELPRHLSPDYVMRIDEGRLVPFLPEGTRITRRQDARPAFVRDGTVYVFWTTHASRDAQHLRRTLPSAGRSRA